jgi:hypothetical protein
MTKARSNATAEAAKGDLRAGTGTNLSGILAVGSNGDTLVADSSTSTGLRYQADFAAGKNKIINGDFGIWQRGTSFTNTSGNGWQYYADRFQCYAYGGTLTVSRQTFAPGAAPVAGYEGSYFMRLNSTSTSTTFAATIEDVRTFAGQTVTISMWLKSASAQSITTNFAQVFGSGGSAAVTVGSSPFATITTSWVRYSQTFAMPSIAGKTIGTNSQLFFQLIGAINNELDVWGVQIEASNTSTAFQTATGTLQGELAACQRYYIRYNAADLSAGQFAQLSQTGFNVTTQLSNIPFASPVTMRTKPTSVDYANVEILDTQAISVVSGGTFIVANPTGATTLITLYTHTAATLTIGKQIVVRNSNNVNGYFGWSAEL